MEGYVKEKETKFIRVSYSFEEIKEWLNGIEAEKLIVYEHEADEEVNRIHVHFYAENLSIGVDALKDRFKKLYKPDMKSNALWCWKTANKDEMSNMVTYMSKGILTPKLIKGEINATDIERWTLVYKAPTLVDGKFVREIKEGTKLTKREMLEQMRSKLSGTSGTRDILKAIRKVLMANNEVIGQYKMMDYFDSIYMYDRKEEWIEMMERKINSKLGI